MLTRRQLMSGAASLAAVSSFPAPAIAQAKPKIIVIGGGAGGASVVRKLSDNAGDVLDVTLIEPQAIYTTCFYSNLYVGGFQSLEALQYEYTVVASRPGVSLVANRAANIDRDARRVTLESGQSLAYDRLVLSPGISLDYASVPGWSKEAEEKMPHAWLAGEQTQTLKRQIDAVPDGGLVVVIAPPNPYRCPPGPYERVSMMAHSLKSSGRGKARIIVLDPKEKFSKQPLFQQAWEKYYPGMIEWMPPMIHAGVKSVDPESMSVETGFEKYRDAALVNVIPRQTAGQIAVDAGLAADNGFCPIDPFTMKSKVDDGIFVLGDASIAGDMPKSAFAANSQAGIVAQVIATELLDEDATESSYRNKCWSLLAADDSVFVSGSYKPTAEKIEQVESSVSTLKESAEVRRVNYEDSAGWYTGLTNALFG